MGIKIEITSGGAVRMLHDDAVDLSEFGKIEIQRASRVEFDNDRGVWFVDSVKTGQRLADNFEARSDALQWEKNHYSPDGDGWNEID